MATRMDRRGLLAAAAGGAAALAGARPRTATAAPLRDGAYRYVVGDAGVDVYAVWRDHAHVKHVPLQGVAGCRGICASPLTGALYVTYGGDGDGLHGPPSMLALDLVTDQVRWRRTYPVGVDAPAVVPGGARIYLPNGELTDFDQSAWYVVSGRTGNLGARIPAGAGPHNTAVGLSGRFAYLASRNSRYLQVASTETNRIVRRVGPFVNGVRPFTVNGRETLSFTTHTRHLGFQVASLVTGRVLHTVDLTALGFAYPSTFGPSGPSHGISLAPKTEEELYVIDAPNSLVHVFDVTGLPERRPRLAATIPVSRLRGPESPCLYDCAKTGWLNHSRGGRWVYVGDAGDVIDTAVRRVAHHLPALAETRRTIEVRFRGGVPILATPQVGLGYVR